MRKGILIASTFVAVVLIMPSVINLIDNRTAEQICQNESKDINIDGSTDYATCLARNDADTPTKRTERRNTANAMIGVIAGFIGWLLYKYGDFDD